tara:strand:- start:24151 stop:24936 length:786 start_codon:yes stop_codon:yes gene_type:complete
MQRLTDVGESLVNDIAFRYGLSREAVLHMLVAVNNGGGSMAQFNCPELGGSGQWMRGGMTMVGDMFNNGLKVTVNNICGELSNILANNQVFPLITAGTPGSNQWWPSDLGSPFSSGAQNNMRYAVFPNRLAVELNGKVSVYDTLNNNISGVSQQQGGNTSLTFSSQFGTIAVTSLPLISGPGIAPAPQTNFAQPSSQSAPKAVQSNGDNFSNNSNSINNAKVPENANDALELLGKLAKLRDAGALTDNEYNAKKAEILNRI